MELNAAFMSFEIFYFADLDTDCDCFVERLRDFLFYMGLTCVV